MVKVHNYTENLLSLEKKVMIYGYIRVSSDKQTVENQRFEINNFCKKEKLIINGWIEEPSGIIATGSLVRKSEPMYLSL